MDPRHVTGGQVEPADVEPDGSFKKTITVERDGAFVPFFPNARYVVVRREWEYWTQPDGLIPQGPGSE